MDGPNKLDAAIAILALVIVGVTLGAFLTGGN
jgi:hypothetical protein